MSPRQPPLDPYAVLGVEPGATQDEIRRAYRSLARKHHPDLNPTRKAEAELKLKHLNEAYTLLRDERRRAVYDQERRRAAAPPPGRSKAASPEFDGAAWRAQRDSAGSYFNRWQERRRDFFRQEPPPPKPGQTRPHQRHQDPVYEDHELHEARLTFKQAVRGITKSFLVGADSPCGLCDGTGRVESEAPRRCQICQRQGLRSITHTGGRWLHVCKFCGWSEEGTIRCPGCAGTGRSKGRRVRVAIPPGLNDGARLRHRVHGLSRPIHIVVKVGGSRVFERGIGQNTDQILTSVTISRELAAKGGQTRVPTIEGWVTVKVPVGMTDGACMKLSGRGVKRRDGSFGDLIVRFDVSA
jgi:molecular chaperone DnaJ